MTYAPIDFALLQVSLLAALKKDRSPDQSCNDYNTLPPVRKRLSRAFCFAKKVKRYAEPAAGIYGGIYTIYTIYSIYSVF